MAHLHRRHWLVAGLIYRRRSPRGDGSGGADPRGPTWPRPDRWSSPRRWSRRTPWTCHQRQPPPQARAPARQPPRPEPLAMAPVAVQAATPGACHRLCRGVQRVAAGRVRLCPSTDPGGQRIGRPNDFLPLRLRGRHVSAQPPGTRQAGWHRRHAPDDVFPGGG